MAPPPRGVVFGPIKDWGKGGCKLLLEHDGEGGLKKRRQYTMEDVAGWALIPEFRERGEEALSQAIVNTEHARARGEWRGEGDWCMHISQVEKDLRDEEEAIKVMDGPSAERAVEILKRSITIQDGTVNGQLEGYDVEYQKSDGDDGSWRASRKRGGARTARTAKEQLARLETELETSRRGRGIGWGVLKKAECRERQEAKVGIQKVTAGAGGGIGNRAGRASSIKKLRGDQSNVFEVPPPAWDLNIDEWPDKESNQGGALPQKLPLLREQAGGRPVGRGSRRLMEDLVEGQGPTNKEDTDMEEETEGTSGQGGIWKAVFELRSELELVGAIRENAEVHLSSQ
ncbi:hypothetical protein BGX38DRAFT_1314369 [Terfezia claveryi]|nr:hypothetical protein BGX38DRAFT_1314369 [Terfezia claveryi]